MVHKRLFTVFFLMFGLLTGACIYGMQQDSVSVNSKKIAFSFDLDDVISGKEKVGFNDFLPLAGMFWNYPRLATAAFPHNQQAIMAHVQNLTDTQKYNGSTNIIRGVIQYLKDNGYGDVSSYEEEINNRTQKPFPVSRMITNIQALKNFGYPVFGATNQDCKQYEVYRAHLKAEHKIDLKDIFDGVVTTPVYHLTQPVGETLTWCYRHNENDHIYVLRDRKHIKPKQDFFQGVAQVIKTYNPAIETIIHTDDKVENNVGAELAGFKSIHFKLPADSVRKTNSEDFRDYHK